MSGPVRHATHMTTPFGAFPLTATEMKTLHAMTDREVADATFSSPPHINPSAFSELVARGLCYRGDREADVYRRVEKRERGDE